MVTLSHDAKLDEPALSIALHPEVFYIGALGSRKTHAVRCARLQERGFGANEIERIHGPIGLDIGARTPVEIALAIMAEMTQCIRQV